MKPDIQHSGNRDGRKENRSQSSYLIIVQIAVHAASAGFENVVIAIRM